MKTLFPYESVRNEQAELLSDIKQTVESGKILFVHAPTGLGKTAAAIAPAIDYALNNKKILFFLTSRHTQHMIAVDTLKQICEKFGLKMHIVDIIAKRNMCIMPGVQLLNSSEFSDYCRIAREKKQCEFYVNTRQGNKITAEAKLKLEELKKLNASHNETLIQSCKNARLCPYEVAALLANDATAIVADYSHIFNSKIRENLLNRIDKGLGDCIVVVDEAHNLPDRLKGFASDRLTTNMMKRALREAKKLGDDEIISIITNLQRALVNISEGLSGYVKEKKIAKDDIKRQVERLFPYDKTIKMLKDSAEEVREEKTHSSIGGVAKFLHSWDGCDEGFARIVSYSNKGDTILFSYKCLDPALIARETLMQIHSTILMSATLHPVEMYADLLGVPEANKEKYDSPFPRGNKLTLIVPKTTTQYKKRCDEQFKRIAGICAGITNNVPGNSAIFFPSYDIRDRVYAFLSTLSDKTIFLETPRLQKDEKAELLNKFSSYNNAVLLAVASGSFGEGIDLPGVLKCVIIVGLPLQQPNLETKELIRYYNKKYGRGWDYGYVYPAINKALQAAGRCIRSEQDKGVIVFLDERYAWKNYLSCFPEGDYRITNDYLEQIDKFFEKDY